MIRYLTVLLFAGALLGQTLPNAVPMPTPEVQYFGSDGLPLAGGKLCSYAAGTSTPQATYTDSTASTPNTNPIILDVAGRASVWVGPQLYKFVLRTGGDSTCTTGSVVWTQDNVADTTLYFVNYVHTAGTATLITYTAPFSGAVTRTVSSKLSDIASVKDFGAAGDGTTDDTAAIQAALDGANTVFVPCGTYIFSGNLDLTDKAQFRFYGEGPCSILKLADVWPAATDALTVSGSTDLEIDHLTFDGALTTEIGMTIIYGDGSGTNTTYGRIKVHHNWFVNTTAQCVGVGATTGHTAEDISITDNVFYNVSFGAEAMHPIDAGSSGIKKRYVISRNQINILTQPASIGTGGNCIFTGHGTNYDFVIADNECINPPVRGIIVFDRPFGSEATALKNFVVSGNTVRNSRGDGIAIFGGDGVIVTGNTILNVGLTTADITYGLLVSNGISGSSPTAPTNIVITSNSIVDDQGSHTMDYGMAFISSPAGTPPVAVVANNTIYGWLTAKFLYTNVDNTTVAIQQPTSAGKWGVDLISTAAATGPLGTWDVAGDILARLKNGDQDVFTGLLMDPDTAAANFLLGFGVNARWDTGTSRWISKNDGAQNGMAGILMTSADGAMQFYSAPSTGASNQSLTAAQWANMKRWTMFSNGYLGSAGRTFAQITADPPADGNFVWCTNCNIIATCTTGGTGAWAFRSHSVWKCPF